MSESRSRCPHCGALVTADAEWCGQCLRRLQEAPTGARVVPNPVEDVEREAGTSSGGVVVPEASDAAPGAGAPVWVCPTCQHENALELDRCDTCGTPFARLFAEPEERAQVPPPRAMGWSLVLPGLGHWMTGRKLDGVARMVLFLWTLGTVLVLLTSRSGDGFGSAMLLFLLFLVATLALYVTSAIDARRIASGDEPLIGSRALLWAAVVLVVVSVLLATVLALPAARGQ